MKVFLALAACYLVLCLFILFFNRRLIYYPLPQVGDGPVGKNLSCRDVFFPAADGVTIHGWVVEPAGGEEVRANVLFFHGNGGNVSYSVESLEVFASLGFRTLIVDYHGYGRSGGRPSEEGLYADAEGALDFFRREFSLEPGGIVYVGRSLGGAVALELALRHPPAGLVLESAFASIRAMSGMLKYIIPIGLLVKDRFDNLSKVGRLRCPLLVVHSPEDETVPFEQGRMLFERAPEPKEFLEITGGHNDGYMESGENYKRGLAFFVMNAMNATGSKIENFDRKSLK